MQGHLPIVLNSVHSGTEELFGRFQALRSLLSFPGHMLPMSEKNNSHAFQDMYRIYNLLVNPVRDFGEINIA